MFRVHSKVTQLYIYTYIIFEIIFHYTYKILTIVCEVISTKQFNKYYSLII